MLTVPARCSWDLLSALFECLLHAMRVGVRGFNLEGLAYFASRGTELIGLQVHTREHEMSGDVGLQLEDFCASCRAASRSLLRSRTWAKSGMGGG